MLKDGLRPAALREAQIAMWKTEPNALPYRWGPSFFKVIGIDGISLKR